MEPLFFYGPQQIRNLITNITSNSDDSFKVLSNNLKLLAGADSIHDFNLKGGRVPVYAWDKSVSPHLLANLNALTKTKVNSFTDWTQGMSSQKVSAGSVEEKTVAYFESTYESELVGKTVILTYRDIITAIGRGKKKGDMNTEILEANLRLCDNADILEIDIAAGENWNVSYSSQDKIDIGLFLLNFYFPPPNAAYNTSNPSYITFDAGSNIPSKIFGLLDQVINLVTPLNIADSATEGTHLAVDKTQKRAGVKNKYVFPVNTLPGQPEGYTYNSNIFTVSNNVKLYITKPGREYDERNKYDFTVFVQQGTGKVCNLIPFTSNDGKTYKSGPGVEYLSEVMNRTPNASPNTGVIAPINTNCGINIDKQPNALYFDVKRSGDWEQCLAALTVNKLMADATPQKGRVILCTIDRLCALFSRCIGQNTLYHYGTQLTLFRYSTNQLTQEEKTNVSNKQAESWIRLYNNIDNFFTTNIDSIFTSIGKNLTLTNSNIQMTGINSAATNNLAKFIVDLATYLMLVSVYKYNEIRTVFKEKANVTGMIPMTPIEKEALDEFLSDIRALTGIFITTQEKTLNEFKANMEKYKQNTTVTTLRNVTGLINVIKLVGGRFCYYDNTLLINTYNILTRINSFDETRLTRTLSLNNYKEQLEKDGLFDTLQDFKNKFEGYNIPNINIFTDCFTRMCETPYGAPPGTEDYEFSARNIAYYNELKTILTSAVNTVTENRQTAIQGGSKSIVTTQDGGETIVTQYGGDTELTGEYKNVYDNLMNSVTDNFVTLVASLNDITMSKLESFVSPMDIVACINALELNNLEQKQVYNLIAVQDNDNTTQILLLLIQSFFENTYNVINETEQIIESWPKTILNYFSNIDSQLTELKNKVNLIKNLYASLYIFFECLYIAQGTIEQEPVIPILGKNSTALNNKNSLNTFVKRPFFNEYFSKIDNTNYVTFEDPYLANIILIVDKCKQIHDMNVPQNVINNIVLFVFTCIYTLINRFVEKYAKNQTRNENDEEIKNSDYGYYPSLIKPTRDDGIDNMFTPFFRIATITYSMSNVNYGERSLFSRIDIILEVFLTRILKGHKYTMTHINAFRDLTDPKTRIGGKRTRKNSTKIKKGRRTIKNRQ
jgi:hypothetical protein